MFPCLGYNEQYANKFIFIVITTGDEFGLPDDSYLYFNKLKGEKYIR